VTRAPQHARAWTAALESRGASVAAREIFVLDSMAGEPAARRALDDVGGYDWILVTSPNGLAFFRRALSARGIEAANLSARFAAVGPKTAAALQASGIRPAVVAARADANGLAAALEAHLGRADRVLIVRPEVSRPQLARRLTDCGAVVDSVPFYRNRASPGVAGVAGELADGKFDAAVFSAPSSFAHLFDACAGAAKRALASIALIAIGETTADAIRAHGCDVAAVAAEPTAEGIADALERVLSK
jgi:uroporphyrinogen III methyltransferase/synthase